MKRNHILLCCVISLLCGCHTEVVGESQPRHDELAAKGLVAVKTITMPKMTFERKPLSDVLSSVYKQCNLRLTEEWGFGVGLTCFGVDLNERYNLEIPELTIYEVFLFIAQRVGANVRYEDGRIYMERLKDERN